MTKRLLATGLCAASLVVAASSTLAADTEYTRIQMEIDIDRPAEAVWERVGDYCDIGEWLDVPCEITTGDGGIGTVRVVAGRVVEFMVAQTELSYGYAQPSVEGQFYNHYHGFMEARPVDDSSSRLIYTLVLDQSNLEDEAARQADIEGRRGMFERALQTMKQLAEAES